MSFSINYYNKNSHLESIKELLDEFPKSPQRTLKRKLNLFNCDFEFSIQRNCSCGALALELIVCNSLDHGMYESK